MSKKECEKICKPKPPPPRDGWKCVETVFDCLGLMRWKECQPCKMPSDPDCNYTSKSDCDAACSNPGVSDIQESCSQSPKQSSGKSHGVALHRGSAVSSALQGGPAGFGFRSSGGVASKCACDSGFTWQKSGDHPCGCDMGQSEPPHPASRSTVQESFPVGDGLAAAPTLASSAPRSACQGDCKCCLKGAYYDLAATTKRRKNPFLQIGTSRGPFPLMASLMFSPYAEVDTPGAGDCASCAMDWHEMWLDFTPMSWQSAHGAKKKRWNVAADSRGASPGIHSHSATAIEVWRSHQPACGQCDQKVKTEVDEPSMYANDWPREQESVQRAALFVRFWGDDPKSCDSARDKSCAWSWYWEACCIFLIVESRVSNGKGSLSAHYFDPVCHSAATCALPDEASVAQCLASGNMSACGFAGKYRGHLKLGDAPVYGLWLRDWASRGRS